LVLAVVVLLVVTLVVFFLMRLLPGDPVLLYISQDQFSRVTPEELAAVRHQFGIDRPIIVQYFYWVSGLLHGDLGKSIFSSATVSEQIGSALPITIHLGILAWIISHLIAVPVGMVCAARRGTWIDTFLTVMANIGITAPAFWVGILLIYLFVFESI
jgi:peptide/nickel transport system permease protein